MRRFRRLSRGHGFRDRGGRYCPQRSGRDRPVDTSSTERRYRPDLDRGCVYGRHTRDPVIGSSRWSGATTPSHSINKDLGSIVSPARLMTAAPSGSFPGTPTSSTTAPSGRTIAEELAGMSGDVRAVHIMPRWGHLSVDCRYVDPETLGKIAYRWEPGMHIQTGAHDIPEGASTGPSGLLAGRHWAYRSFEQFQRKVHDGCARIEPETRARMRCRPHFKDGRIRRGSDARRMGCGVCATPTVHEPIPLRFET